MSVFRGTALVPAGEQPSRRSVIATLAPGLLSAILPRAKNADAAKKGKRRQKRSKQRTGTKPTIQVAASCTVGETTGPGETSPSASPRPSHPASPAP